MRFTQDYEQLRDAEVVDVNGDRVGGVGQVYLNDTSGEVEWVTVKTGFFGLKETLVPMSGATVADGRIQVPYEKAFIKDAPNVDAEAHLDEGQQQELHRYYGDGRVDRTDAGYGDETMAGTAGRDMDAGRDLDRRDGDLVGGDLADRDLADRDLADRDRADRDLAEGTDPDRGGLDRGLGSDRNMDEGLGSEQGFGSERGMATEDDGFGRGDQMEGDRLADERAMGDQDPLAQDGDRLDGDRDLISGDDMVADPRGEDVGGDRDLTTDADRDPGLTGDGLGADPERRGEGYRG